MNSWLFIWTLTQVNYIPTLCILIYSSLNWFPSPRRFWGSRRLVTDSEFSRKSIICATLHLLMIYRELEFSLINLWCSSISPSSFQGKKFVTIPPPNPCPSSSMGRLSSHLSQGQVSNSLPALSTLGHSHFTSSW